MTWTQTVKASSNKQEESNAYMHMIAANIARNNKKLQQLGLGSGGPKMAKKTKTTGTGEIKYTAAKGETGSLADTRVQKRWYSAVSKRWQRFPAYPPQVRAYSRITGHELVSRIINFLHQ